MICYPCAKINTLRYRKGRFFERKKSTLYNLSKVHRWVTTLPAVLNTLSDGMPWLVCTTISVPRLTSALFMCFPPRQWILITINDLFTETGVHLWWCSLSEASLSPGGHPVISSSSLSIGALPPRPLPPCAYLSPEHAPPAEGQQGQLFVHPELLHLNLELSFDIIELSRADMVTLVAQVEQSCCAH